MVGVGVGIAEMRSGEARKRNVRQGKVRSTRDFKSNFKF